MFPSHRSLCPQSGLFASCFPFCMHFSAPPCMLCGLSVCHHLMTFIIFCEESILQSPSLCTGTQFFSIYDFLHLRSQHSPQQCIFQQPKLCSILRVWVLVSCPCTTVSIKVFFIRQLMHKWIVLKTILKFKLKLTSKQLRHVSVQSHHHQGAYYLCLLKLQLLK